MDNYMPVNPHHKAMFNEIVGVLKKHEGSVSPLEILALLSQLLGGVLLMQDDGVPMTAYWDIVRGNIEIGNQAAIISVIGDTKGNA